MDSGFVEFKCHGCGKFASTDECKKPNEPKNFEVICVLCGSKEWESKIQDVDCEDEETHIECAECGAKTFNFEELGIDS